MSMTVIHPSGRPIGPIDPKVRRDAERFFDNLKASTLALLDEGRVEVRLERNDDYEPVGAGHIPDAMWMGMQLAIVAVGRPAAKRRAEAAASEPWEPEADNPQVVS